MPTTSNELDISAAIQSLATQIAEAHSNLNNIVLVGILPYGPSLANRLQHQLKQLTQTAVPVGKIEVSLYRDDLPPKNEFMTLQNTDIPFDINGKTLILVTDVLFEGRKTRAALNGLTDFGRPDCIELAALVDRGHRKLPIQATFVGEALHTQYDDEISLKLIEVDGEDALSFTPANS